VQTFASGGNFGGKDRDMALFTNKTDRKVPILSQFYQLEFDPKGNLIDSELDFWIPRALGFFDGGTWSSRGIANLKDDLTTLANLHTHLKPLMDGIADGWKAPVPVITGDVMADGVKKVLHENYSWVSIHFARKEHLEYLNARCKELSPKIRFDFDEKEKDIKCVEVSTHEVILVAQLIYQFKYGVERDAFARCEECENVFLSIRGGKFCSHRCKARVSGRRTYRVKDRNS
jgi:hypothetical protein